MKTPSMLDVARGAGVSKNTVSLAHVVGGWVERMGLRISDDLGLIQLEWREDHRHWTGMNQHNDIVGEAAVEMVVGMIHNGKRGIPSSPRATLIGSTWVGGETVRPSPACQQRTGAM